MTPGRVVHTDGIDVALKNFELGLLYLQDISILLILFWCFDDLQDDLLSVLCSDCLAHGWQEGKEGPEKSSLRAEVCKDASPCTEYL